MKEQGEDAMPAGLSYKTEKLGSRLQRLLNSTVARLRNRCGGCAEERRLSPLNFRNVFLPNGIEKPENKRKRSLHRYVSSQNHFHLGTHAACDK